MGLSLLQSRVRNGSSVIVLYGWEAEEDAAAAAVYIFSFHFVPLREGGEEGSGKKKEPPEEFQQGASSTLPGSLFWAPFRPHQPQTSCEAAERRSEAVHTRATEQGWAGPVKGHRTAAEAMASLPTPSSKRWELRSAQAHAQLCNEPCIGLYFFGYCFVATSASLLLAVVALKMVDRTKTQAWQSWHQTFNSINHATFLMTQDLQRNFLTWPLLMLYQKLAWRLSCLLMCSLVFKLYLYIPDSIRYDRTIFLKKLG